MTRKMKMNRMRMISLWMMTVCRLAISARNGNTYSPMRHYRKGRTYSASISITTSSKSMTTSTRRDRRRRTSTRKSSSIRRIVRAVVKRAARRPNRLLASVR
uniref:Putative secreted peptide n=1 Tax=Anopheles braziliensis TaxID=58242 RepID=A0A2M3ZSI6_9DIPT